MAMNLQELAFLRQKAESLGKESLHVIDRLQAAADWILEQCVEGEPGAEEGLRRLIRYETDNALKAMNLHL